MQIMRKRNRLTALTLAGTAFVLGFFAPGPRAGEIMRLRCRWQSPNDTKLLDMTFIANPMVVMAPGANLEVTSEEPSGPNRVAILKEGVPFREDIRLVFTAPEKPGSYYMPLRITSNMGQREAELCVLVPHKATAGKTGDGLMLRADGQQIGTYRHHSRSGNAKVKANPESYQPPAWWMRITEMNASYEVVPGLRADDLVAVTEDTGLKHTDLVPVCYPMWQAIHTLRNALQERKGIPGSALKLISMFRAPPYNRAVGSNAFGRHIYGDAFDFYIDTEGDGKASDLNRDGKLDRRDAYEIVALIEDLQAEKKLPMGGIGVYNSVAGDHVVTMHLDMRGHRATWGYLYSASGKKSEFSWASKRFADLDKRDEQAAAARAAKEGRKYSPPRREPLPGN